jgi:UrcA family protein
VRKAIGSMAAVAIVLASSLASGAQAQVDVRQRVVRYADLNLSNRADAVALYKRISHAAHVVCYIPTPFAEASPADAPFEARPRARAFAFLARQSCVIRWT